MVKIKKGKEEDIFIQVDSINDVKAPIYKGQKVGKLTILSEDNPIFEVDLLVKETIRKKQISDYFFNIFNNMCIFYEFI